MMETPEDFPVVGADAKTIKYFYSKRNELVPPISLTSPPLGRQILSIADSTHAFNCNELYEQGSFYEINHDQLPPKSPIQLKAIRAVMVAESTMLNVTVSFPSTLALRSYFTTDHMVDFPELDERFVMSTNQAGRILRCRIPPALLEAGKNLKSFWLLNPASLATELPLVESDKEDDHTKPLISIGTSVLSLKCAKVVGWGIRRKVKYIGQHCGSTAEQKLVQSGGGRKRTQEISKNHGNKQTKKKKKGVDGRETKKPKAEQAVEEKCTRGSKDRWSTERYKAAEKRLLEIMRAKKAELGTPVLRQALRDEARKHIGDTGLLDHLLKHMAGKTVSNGMERFRRRHNSEGAMEYWLEPAELVEIRLEAGVNDSFWVPPPGWKLGDSLFPGTCGSDCELAIADLKQQVATQLTRCDEQQNSLKKLEKEARDIKVESEKIIGAWQDKCQNLLDQKRKQEEELVALFDYMRGIKEEVQQLKEKQKPEKELSTREQQAIRNEGIIAIAKNIGNEVSGAKKAARRSGFTICQPQGTFLWPSMVTTPGLVNLLSPRAQGVMFPATSVHLTSNISCASELEQQQNLMVFPVSGPPSASSSTAPTAPKLHFLPTPGLESDVMAVPQLMLLQRAASPKNLCTPRYNCTMPCVYSHTNSFQKNS